MLAIIPTLTTLAKKGIGASAREFRQAVLEAVRDGKLTKEEIDGLETMREELDLPLEVLDAIRVQAYVIAFQHVREDVEVTDDEWDELEHIQDYLGLKDREIAKNKKELLRLRVLTEIKKGNLPVVDLSHLILQKDETPYWSEPVTLQREAQHSMEGELMLTNQRIVFHGQAETLALPLTQIIDVDYGDTGMRIHPNRRKNMLFLYKDPQNHDIVGSVLFAAIAEKVQNR